jgi:hypothetical protein
LHLRQALPGIPRGGIVEVEKSGSKTLHKLVLYSVKVIPVIITGIYVLNTALSYFGIDWEGFSYIVQFLFIIHMYLTSFTFMFCMWHRMLIHYILIVLILNIVDYHWGIPVSDRSMFLIYMVLAGVFIFLAIYFHLRDIRN